MAKKISEYGGMEKYASKAAMAKHEKKESKATEKKEQGLYANIQAKKKRIEAGSGEKMRKPGTKGAPTAQAFKMAAKTAKKK